MPGELFGYELVGHLDDSLRDCPPTRLHIHASILAAPESMAMDSIVACLFPLCGVSHDDWIVGEVMSIGQITNHRLVKSLE